MLPMLKMNPPLRSENDLKKLKLGLRNDTIEVIASDHAPHTAEEKNRGWDKASFGVIGLETTLGVVLTELVHTRFLTLEHALTKMTNSPAKIFKLKDRGTIDIGKPADISIIDLNKEWIVDVNKFESKARNCPFSGRKLKGKAICTIVNGRIVMENGRIIESKHEDSLTRSEKHVLV